MENLETKMPELKTEVLPFDSGAYGLNIYQRILRVMEDVKYIAKGDKRVNGQYTFVSHDDVVAKLHPALVKHGIVVVPTVEECTQDGNRTSVKLCVVFRNADLPQDAFAVHHYGYGIDGGGFNKDGKPVSVGDKGPGKAVSYAFKYALLKTFCLETGDDPDNDANARYEPAKCLEFDAMLSDVADAKEMKRILAFVEERSQSLNKHPEDIKREAIKRFPEFLEAIKKWKPTKKD